MTDKHVLLAALIGVLCAGCVAQPSQPQGRPGMLIGSDSSGVRVLIKRVDNGPILYATRDALGSKVTIAPGHHTVNVVCEMHEAGLSMISADVALDVSPGQVYDLVGSAAAGSSGCNVAASARS